jgi:hypothetical protein
VRSLRAARHELRCWECRVTWKSWLQRLLGISKGYTPAVPPRSIRWPELDETFAEGVRRLMEDEDQ